MDRGKKEEQLRAQASMQLPASAPARSRVPTAHEAFSGTHSSLLSQPNPVKTLDSCSDATPKHWEDHGTHLKKQIVFIFCVSCVCIGKA